MLRLAPAKLAAGHGGSGLVRFAQVALDVAQTTVPRYRTPFGQHRFMQPQRSAILRHMHYKDWTYREAEVRLTEHSDLRRTLQLRSAPDYTLCTVSCGGWRKPPSRRP
jgi:hypothetical protein